MNNTMIILFGILVIAWLGSSLVFINIAVNDAPVNSSLKQRRKVILCCLFWPLLILWEVVERFWKSIRKLFLNIITIFRFVTNKEFIPYGVDSTKSG